MSELRDRHVPGGAFDVEGTDENDAPVSETVTVGPGLYVRRRWRARLRALGWPRSWIRYEAGLARATRRAGGTYPGVYLCGTGVSQARLRQVTRITVPTLSGDSGSFTIGWA